MEVAVVIPARYSSSRLPGKPLLRQTGKYLIQHVYELAEKAKCASQVIVATDDERIQKAVESFGGRVVMTRSDHPSGTDRVAEVAKNLSADLIINLQGDEPTLEPDLIDLLSRLMAEDTQADMATLAVRIHDREVYLNPNVVKLVRDDRGRALYFSRSPIPFIRDPDDTFPPPAIPLWQHLGIYAYRRPFLLQLAKMKPHPIEEAEKLEQLRVLGSGGTIQVGETIHAHRGVDTPADYEAFVHQYCTTRRAA